MEQKHKKSGLRQLFNSFTTKVWLREHDAGFLVRPEEMQKKFKKQWGRELKPQLYNPISIQWSEKGRGFGEYHFWELDGQIFCDNECDSREAVKRVLCQMVDQALFIDDRMEPGVNPKHKKLLDREIRLRHAAYAREKEKRNAQSKKKVKNVR